MPRYGAPPRRAAQVQRSPAVAAGLAMPGLPRGKRGPKLGPLKADLPARIPAAVAADETAQVQHGFPPPPESWEDSDAEWAIYWAHEALRRGEPGQVWFYRTPFAGQLWLTGFVPDFLETDVAIVIDVLGTDAAGDQRGIIRLREAIMRGLGYEYIVIDEDRALLNPIAALRDALTGRRTSIYQ